MFKALADRNRRTLLDQLFQQDGQTLNELCGYLDMSRYGVMKHLQILEDAGLISTRKVGRSKYHYLNPVPIQSVYERWVSKYAQPWTSTLSGIKTVLEDSIMKPDHVYHTFIRTTPEKLWQALTDGTITQQYYFGTRVESTWEPGAPYRYLQHDGVPMIEGEVLESQPFERLVTTFNALWIDEAERDDTTTVTFEIEPVGDSCKLTLTHAGLTPGLSMTAGIHTGWAQIMSSMKSLLETGEPLVIEAMT